MMKNALRQLSNASSKTVAALALSAGLLVSACAGSAQYATGVQASAAPQMFTGLKRVAAAHRMEVQEQGAQGISLKTAEGDWLQYSVFGKEVTLVVNAAGEGRQDKLKSLGESLVREATGATAAR